MPYTPVDATVDFVQSIQRGLNGFLIRTTLNALSVPTRQNEKRPAGLEKNSSQDDVMRIIRFAMPDCRV